MHEDYSDSSGLKLQADIADLAPNPPAGDPDLEVEK